MTSAVFGIVLIEITGFVGFWFQDVRCHFPRVSDRVPDLVVFVMLISVPRDGSVITVYNSNFLTWLPANQKPCYKMSVHQQQYSRRNLWDHVFRCGKITALNVEFDIQNVQLQQTCTYQFLLELVHFFPVYVWTNANVQFGQIISRNWIWCNEIINKIVIMKYSLLHDNRPNLVPDSGSVHMMTLCIYVIGFMFQWDEYCGMCYLIF